MNSYEKKTLCETVLKWQRPIYNLSYRMLGNEADAADATQEIFSRFLRKVGHLPRVREFKAWFYRLATNVILNQTRERRLRHRKESELAQRNTKQEHRDILERS